MKLFFVDLETTGLDRDKHGIHQISGAIVIDGVTVETFDFKVQPSPACVIDPKALNACGVTFEQINAYPPMNVVYNMLKELLSKYVDLTNPNDKYFITGYNSQKFDAGHLGKFFQINFGLPFFKQVFWLGATIDVMVIANYNLVNDRRLLDNLKLSTIAKYLGIDVKEDKLHDAEYDIWLTIEVYKRVGGKF